jgi:uncharacterized protein YndB with AHSA1/START domain
MRKKIELEYIFSSSVNVLFSRLSTAAGLSEWFSDDVRHKGSTFTFVWDGVGSRAELVELKKNVSARFRWADADDGREYFEFSLHVEPLTSEVALIITDFVDEEEEDDAVELWNKQIEMLHRTIGA